MGFDRASFASGKGPRSPSHERPSRGRQCAALHGFDRLPVADVAQRLSALFDGPDVFLSLARPAPAGKDQPTSSVRSAPGSRPLASTDGGGDGRPERAIGSPDCATSSPMADILARSSAALRKMGTWNLEIIRRSDKAKGFEVLPGQWVALRTLAWSGRSRRLARDWEHTLESAIAWRIIANIRPMTRRIARR
jgi:transposase